MKDTGKTEPSGRRRQRRGLQVLGLGAQKIAGQGLAVVSTFLLLRFSSVEAFGAYIYGFVLVQMITIFTVFGLVPLVIREHAQQQDATGRRIDRGTPAMRFALAAAAALSLLAMGFVWLASGATDKISGILPWLLPALALLRLLAGKLQGLGHLQSSQLPEPLLVPLLMILGAGAARALLGRPLGAEDLLWLYLAALLACVAFCLVALHLAATAERNGAACVDPGADPTPGWPSLGRTAFAMGIGSSAWVFNRQADLFFVGTLLSAEMVSYYKVGAQIAYLVVFGLQIGSVILAREFAASASRAALGSMAGTMRKAALTIATIAVTVYAAILLAGDRIATLMLSEPAPVAQAVMLVLGAGLLLSALAGNIGNLLNMTGNQWVNSRIMLISVACNLVLNYLLIQWFGAVGAAAATSITLAFVNIAQTLVARSQLGVSTDIVYALFRR